MASHTKILVTTTSTIDGVKIKKHIKPVSAHIVAGTNLFTEFLGDWADVFGGRSKAYQDQLSSLYNEAIEKLKMAAYQLGANCIIGLSVDMDEISGKNKSMFMITAIGTAVIIEANSPENEAIIKTDTIIENVGVDKINALRNKNLIIEGASQGELILDDKIWNFIISNQIEEVSLFLIKKYTEAVIDESMHPEVSSKFYKQLVIYFDSLPDDSKFNLLYGAIEAEKNERVILKLSEIIKELNLFNYEGILRLFNNSAFNIKKRGLRISTYDKTFFNKNDKEDLQKISAKIGEVFIERGIRTLKKQLLSSKEKEVWTCECGKTNDLDSHCSGCELDIYGFYRHEIKPLNAKKYIEQKIELISQYVG
ncbi:hypothetical protein GCM10027275_16590 [Rhabdobacter roseus]|uniref:Uncharacterized protein YbjQ (UPF0145 family) n=1 Tax=Rhabdobacter roseus TaxID=1655419 RepID=A0A840TUB0_9BACT|nr:heavy metal-binding domain-containing protein [Rhabdobacter roseus]MBB5283580.1 uncharacterized protein YbjQ (UPF0145 family) [Rhabdobacter roseus]